MFKKKDQVKKSLTYINSRNRNIKFTCAEEKGNKVSFLDISMGRSNNALKRTKWFTSVNLNLVTSALMLIAFYQHNIRGLLHTFLYRTYNICSNYFQIHEEINHLKSVCQKNCIHKFLNKLLIKGVRGSTTTQKKEITISLEYLGKISLLAKKKKNIFRSCHKHIKLNVVFKTSNRLCNAFRFKDHLPNCIDSIVLYKYKCDICNGFYIGKTSHHLIVSQYENLGKSIATDKPLRHSDKGAAAIRKRSHSLDHLASIDDFSIL